jgi:hypothetical protein
MRMFTGCEETVREKKEVVVSPGFRSDFIQSFPVVLSSSPGDDDPVDPLAFEEEVSDS